MLLYILLALAVLIIGLLVYASTEPNTMRYERSTVINAQPERILPHIIDFHKWMAWSPYEKLDPQMKRTFSGAEEGKGAKYSWEGNSKAGMGHMEILETSTSGVKMDPHFIKPFKTDCVSSFIFGPQAGATEVTWRMEGPNLFIGKVMSIFMDMDKMVGGQFASWRWRPAPAL